MSGKSKPGMKNHKKYGKPHPIGLTVAFGVPILLGLLWKPGEWIVVLGMFGPIWAVFLLFVYEMLAPEEAGRDPTKENST